MVSNLKWKVAQQLEIKWWKRYLKHKNVDEYLSWKKKYWIDFLQQIPDLPKLQQLQILDAGCGPAGIFMVLDKNQVDAVDPLINQYQSLPHFDVSNYTHTQFITKSIEEIDVIEKYDVIFCLNAINHVADIQLAYHKLTNALKKGGRMYVSVDAHRFAILKKIFQILPGDALHPHQYDLQEYETFLKTEQLEVLPSILIKKEPIFDYYLCIAKK